MTLRYQPIAASSRRREDVSLREPWPTGRKNRAPLGALTLPRRSGWVQHPRTKEQRSGQRHHPGVFHETAAKARSARFFVRSRRPVSTARCARRLPAVSESDVEARAERASGESRQRAVGPGIRKRQMATVSASGPGFLEPRTQNPEPEPSTQNPEPRTDAQAAFFSGLLGAGAGGWGLGSAAARAVSALPPSCATAAYSAPLGRRSRLRH